VENGTESEKQRHGGSNGMIVRFNVAKLFSSGIGMKK
jgi:hypothetical protein